MGGISRWLIVIGVLFVVAGLLWPWLAGLGLGRLPGDILIERERVRIYVPLMTCLIVSLVLSIVIWIINR